MSKKRSESSKAFFVGSWVGLAQATVGIAVSMRAGPVAAFLASVIIYVVFHQAYLWATSPGEKQ